MCKRNWLFFFASLALMSVSCQGPARLHRESRLMMDTYVTLTVFAPPNRTRLALDAAFRRLEEIEHKFNHLDTASPIYAFNIRNEPITDSELVNVIQLTQTVSEASAGTFDITIEPLVRLWGFYGDNPSIPEKRAIDSCRKLVDFRSLLIADGQVKKQRRSVSIDLGGIAKGYALSEVARVLRKNKVDSALIDLGGDIYAIGNKGREPWRVGIRNPRGQGVIGVMSLHNQAAVTSGDYERCFFGPDSIRYCHILDPRTGWPARGIISATVVTDNPVLAQGWSKVLFILGKEAVPLLEALPGTQALAVDSQGEIICTRGWLQQ